DPKLTAFALGELDPAEAREVEALIAENQTAQTYVREVRRLADRVSDEFAREQAPALGPHHRSAIDREIVRRGGGASAGWRLPAWLPMGLAAAVAVGVGWFALREMFPGFSPPGPERGPVAMHDELLKQRTAGTGIEATDESKPDSLGGEGKGLAAKSTPAAPVVAAPSEPARTNAPRPGAAGPPPPLAPAVPQPLVSKPKPTGARSRLGAVGNAVAERRKMAGASADVSAGFAGSTALKSKRDALAFAGEALEKTDQFALAGAAIADKEAPNREAYEHIVDNPFHRVLDDPLSTFSVDVDTASYANIRRFLTDGRLPPKGAVRIEEMVNYFRYAYAQPDAGQPFSASVEVAGCPWAPKHRLVRVGLQGREVRQENRPPVNLVFLMDVSGSMRSAKKLELVKASLKLLVDQLEGDDRIAIAVYAGAAGLVLPSTAVAEKHVIVAALDRLRAGGSTNGGAGIRLAYKVANENYLDGGINRVILATDGDLNVGTTSNDALVSLIREQAGLEDTPEGRSRSKRPVFLTVLGVGTGNLQDAKMEKIANKGNGQYAYIDSLTEGRRVLVEDLSGTLVTIAKDVKIQIEFNPAEVAAYRLIGYENRMLAKQDFNDDTKDAGEIGAGHTVTALYEVVPNGLERRAEVAKAAEAPAVDDLEFQKPRQLTQAAFGGKMMLVKLRYKDPDGLKSRLLKFPVTDSGRKADEASPQFTFASAVAAFGMVLRDSPHKGSANFDLVAELAQGSLAAEQAKGQKARVADLRQAVRAEGEFERRQQFIRLVQQAKALAGQR
ncbi:MAG: von Willebrand factor type A domain-containing protein, partial [Phycisphaerae bacterium]|nr:von Willebrand factor type A domain-containing protein [Phycisphaerae bacterium]